MSDPSPAMAQDRIIAPIVGRTPRVGRFKQTLAMDRATVRAFDEDGRLHIAVSNISKANVCPYMGREIPANGQTLDPNRVYMLLRHPDELAAAAKTFNNIPLLSVHTPISADDYDPALIVGSTGTDASFVLPYLRNSLVVWNTEAIAGIETNAQRELSSAYRYEVEWTPGEYQGEKYDGIMRNIRGNHVALVEAGRAGSDVIVGDSRLAKDAALMSFREKLMANTPAHAALSAALGPKLAQDAKLDDVLAAMQGAGIRMQLAQDADPDEDEDEKKRKQAQDADPDDDEDEKKRKQAQDADPDEDEDKKKQAQDSKLAARSARPAAVAMDAAMIREQVRSEVMAQLRDATEARELVRPLVGTLPLAMDSAPEIYKVALDAAKVDLAGVPPSAYRAMVKLLPRADAARPAPVVAMDSAFTSRWPGADKLKIR